MPSALLLLSSATACVETREPCTLDDERCDGDVRIACATDHETQQQYKVYDDCADIGMHCAFAGGQDSMRAFCAQSSAPLPACEGKMYACEGDVLVACANGFPTERVDCRASNEYCVQLTSYRATCLASREPDPRCATSSVACDGDIRVECSGGYALSEGPCPGCTSMGSYAVNSDGASCW